MPKIMIINVTHAEESRVGIVTNNVLTSFEIESFSREHLKGNLYKGVVHRIHQALEAAFVDIGADRDAFLPLDEICFRNLPNQPPRDNGNGERRRPRITEVLKPGQEVLVQIIKEQFANKPPSLSTYYSLAGRYLVLLPGSDETGISRRIEGAERERLRELIDKLEAPKGFGVIVRTVAGFDPGERELQRDLTYLRRLWDSIQQASETKRGPALIYREHDLVLRNIRDYFTPDIDEVWIDNDEVFQRARDFFRDVMPEREDVLRLYEGDKPIFSHFNVESQIESIYKRRVPLKSGGSIVIDGTEALTAIDVNSGRSIRGGTQEETAFKTNIEAANEIARQLRLRDLGGLIVIDFIDMRAPQHIQEVERTLRAAMHEDKARHELGHISQFGLLEVSRQRLRPAAAATSYAACPRCDGHGLVRTTESAALVALRKIHLRIAQGDVSAVKVSLPSEVGLYLLNQKREDLAQLERRYAVRLQIVLSDKLMPHQSEFETRPRVDSENEPQQMRLGGVTQPDAPEAATGPEATEGDEPVLAASPAATPSAPSASAAVESAGEPGNGGIASKRKRRRGRRRGRGKAAAAAIGEALAALGAQSTIATAPSSAATAEGEVLDEEREARSEMRPAMRQDAPQDLQEDSQAQAADEERADEPNLDVRAESSPSPRETSGPQARRSRRGGRGRGRGRGRGHTGPPLAAATVAVAEFDREIAAPLANATSAPTPTLPEPVGAAPVAALAASPQLPQAEVTPAVTSAAPESKAKRPPRARTSTKSSGKSSAPARKPPAKTAVAKKTISRKSSKQVTAKAKPTRARSKAASKPAPD